MRDSFRTRWVGLLLAGIVLVATLWLFATDSLTLYMHPRYLVFTGVMVGIALVAVLGAVLVLAGRRAARAHDHAHAHAHADADADAHGADGHVHAPRGRVRTALGSVGLIAAVAGAVALLLIAPATSLTAQTASARTVSSSADLAASDVDAETVAAGDTDFTQLGIEDWVALIDQTTDPAFYAGKDAQVVGFVSPDPDDPDAFFVSRFVVTCCTVDAQAIGLPVHDPEWASTYDEGDWVQVDGELAANPTVTSDDAIALLPTRVTGVSEPKQPYVY